jgi:hypothetical protein
MPFRYALPFVYWQKLTKNATINQLQPKTCQKPHPKTPQKSSKKPQWVGKNLVHGQKLSQNIN